MLEETGLLKFIKLWKNLKERIIKPLLWAENSKHRTQEKNLNTALYYMNGKLVLENTNS